MPSSPTFENQDSHVLDRTPDVSVTLGTVVPDDFLGLFQHDPPGAYGGGGGVVAGLGRNIFVDYMIYNRYEKDYHRYMLGVTSPTGFLGRSAAFVQLAAPTLLWIADWTASQLNRAPTIPSPETTDPRWILLDEHVEPVMLILAPDGITPLYRISGYYVYGCVDPSVFTVDDVCYPRPPWMRDIPPRHVPRDRLATGLTECSTTPSTTASPGVPGT